MCSGIWTCYELYALASSWSEKSLGNYSLKQDSIGDAICIVFGGGCGTSFFWKWTVYDLTLKTFIHGKEIEHQRAAVAVGLKFNANI